MFRRTDVVAVANMDEERTFRYLFRTAAVLAFLAPSTTTYWAVYARSSGAATPGNNVPVPFVPARQRKASAVVCVDSEALPGGAGRVRKTILSDGRDAAHDLLVIDDEGRPGSDEDSGNHGLTRTVCPDGKVAFVLAAATYGDGLHKTGWDWLEVVASPPRLAERAGAGFQQQGSWEQKDSRSDRSSAAAAAETTTRAFGNFPKALRPQLPLLYFRALGLLEGHLLAHRILLYAANLLEESYGRGESGAPNHPPAAMVVYWGSAGYFLPIGHHRSQILESDGGLLGGKN